MIVVETILNDKTPQGICTWKADLEWTLKAIKKWEEKEQSITFKVLVFGCN